MPSKRGKGPVGSATRPFKPDNELKCSVELKDVSILEVAKLECMYAVSTDHTTDKLPLYVRRTFFGKVWNLSRKEGGVWPEAIAREIAEDLTRVYDVPFLCTRVSLHSERETSSIVEIRQDFVTVKRHLLQEAQELTDAFRKDKKVDS